MVAESGLICIVGPHAFQNTLFSSLLENKIKVKCLCRPDGEGATELRREETEGRCLLLWDCLPYSPSALWQSVSGVVAGPDHRRAVPVGLFNVRPEWRIEKAALNAGARGVIYDSDSREIAIKGVRAMLNGELWYSRTVLERSIKEAGMGAALPRNDDAATLSAREKEVLRHIAGGRSNMEMSELLGVSVHTVKTHVYNIYRKLNVSKRLAAAQWAVANLAFPEPEEHGGEE